MVKQDHKEGGKKLSASGCKCIQSQKNVNYKEDSA